MITEAMNNVAEFHEKLQVSPPAEYKNHDLLKMAGRTIQEIANSLCADAKSPHLPADVQAIVLRAHLITEELSELLLAKNEVQALDAITDLLYVVLGTAVTFGWDLEGAFKEVHRSNMSKERQEDDIDKHRVRSKGPNYTKPDLVPFVKVKEEE